MRESPSYFGGWIIAWQKIGNFGRFSFRRVLIGWRWEPKRDRLNHWNLRPQKQRNEMAPRQYARLNNQKQTDPINWPFFIFQFFICIFALRAVSVSFAHHESKNFSKKGINLIYSNNSIFHNKTNEIKICLILFLTLMEN